MVNGDPQIAVGVFRNLFLQLVTYSELTLGLHLLLPHSESLPIGIAEAIHAMHALNPLDVIRQCALFG